MIDKLDFDKFCQERYDESFGAYFNKRCSPVYHDLFNRLQEDWLSLEFKANAIHGFHFSPKNINAVNPRSGEMYLFLQRPTKTELQEIARSTAEASGWAGRSHQTTRNQPVIIYCYEIHPSDEIINKQVMISRNAKYTASQIEGFKVSAPDSFSWNITDSKKIIVLANDTGVNIV